MKGGGYVCGAAYGPELSVKHMFIDNVEHIELLRQSKYVQSSTGSSFIEAKEKLCTGRLVVFVGTPCQIAGLYSFLGKEYDNLITIEFICLGVNSPKAYQKWLQDLESRKGIKIARVWFKYKSEGWRRSPFVTRIDFVDGSYTVLNHNNNYYMRGYLEKNLYLRPSCSSCKFMGIPRVADITLGDFWGLDPEEDDDKGTSMIMINSLAGEKLFDLLKDTIQSQRQPLSIVRKGNVHFEIPAEYNPCSKEFLQRIENEDFEKCIKEYLPSRNIINRVLNKMKRIFG